MNCLRGAMADVPNYKVGASVQIPAQGVQLTQLFIPPLELVDK